MVSITRFSPAIDTRPVPTSSNNRGCDSTAVAAFSTLVRAVIVATPRALDTSTGTDRPAMSPDSPISASSATRSAFNAASSRTCAACAAWDSRSSAPIRSVIATSSESLAEVMFEGSPISAASADRSHPVASAKALNDCFEHTFILAPPTDSGEDFPQPGLTKVKKVSGRPRSS